MSTNAEAFQKLQSLQKLHRKSNELTKKDNEAENREGEGGSQEAWRALFDKLCKNGGDMPVSEFIEEIEKIPDSQQAKRSIILNAVWFYLYNNENWERASATMKSSLYCVDKDGKIKFNETDSGEPPMARLDKTTSDAMICYIKRAKRVDKTLREVREEYNRISGCLTEDEQDELRSLKRFADTTLQILQQRLQFSTGLDRAFLIRALFYPTVRGLSFDEAKKAIEEYWAKAKDEKGKVPILWLGDMSPDEERHLLETLRTYITQCKGRGDLDRLRGFKEIWDAFLRGEREYRDESKKVVASDGASEQPVTYSRLIIFEILNRVKTGLAEAESQAGKLFSYLSAAEKEKGISLKLFVRSLSRMVQYRLRGFSTEEIVDKTLRRLDGISLKHDEKMRPGRTPDQQKEGNFLPEEIAGLQDFNWEAEMAFIKSFFESCVDKWQLGDFYKFCYFAAGALGILPDHAISSSSFKVVLRNAENPERKSTKKKDHKERTNKCEDKDDSVLSLTDEDIDYGRTEWSHRDNKSGHKKGAVGTTIYWTNALRDTNVQFNNRRTTENKAKSRTAAGKKAMTDQLKNRNGGTTIYWTNALRDTKVQFNNCRIERKPKPCTVTGRKAMAEIYATEPQRPRNDVPGRQTVFLGQTVFLDGDKTIYFNCTRYKTQGY